jgi:hypothetical protein
VEGTEVRDVREVKIAARPNKRLQLALQRIVQQLLLCGNVTLLQLVTSRFGLCSVNPRVPHGAAEARNR